MIRVQSCVVTGLPREVPVSGASVAMAPPAVDTFTSLLLSSLFATFCCLTSFGASLSQSNAGVSVCAPPSARSDFTAQSLTSHSAPTERHRGSPVLHCGTPLHTHTRPPPTQKEKKENPNSPEMPLPLGWEVGRNAVIYGPKPHHTHPNTSTRKQHRSGPSQHELYLFTNFSNWMEGGDAHDGAACTSRGLVLVCGREGCRHHAAAHLGRRERERGGWIKKSHHQSRIIRGKKTHKASFLYWRGVPQR